MRVSLQGPTDLAGFRQWARVLLARRVSPDEVVWTDGAVDDLFAGTPAPAPRDGEIVAPFTVPASFVELCESVALHADPNRFALMYRLLWRLREEPGLRGDPLDPDVLLARRMAHAVRHEMHKMRAFVRFRPVADPEGGGDAIHVAWFEPEHHIVEANAPWFRRRFTNMRWAVLTPRRCVEWDGDELRFGDGARRADAPAADAGEQLWLTYYASIFNPARLKLGMMRKEMPRRYWKNLPEAALISPLAAAATERAGAMIEHAPSEPDHRVRRTQRIVVPIAAAVDSLDALRQHVSACAECPIGSMATQAVMGEGPASPALMLVGEQPGDQEDLAGGVFVGPAGKLLDRALAQAGIDRESVFLTNAVRHFKYEMRGKRRIHKTASQTEAAACSQWLEHEIALVKPKALVALGATAARSLLQRDVSVRSGRGAWYRRSDGAQVLVTWHPSALLRMQPAERQAAFDLLVNDLETAREARW